MKREQKHTNSRNIIKVVVILLVIFLTGIIIMQINENVQLDKQRNEYIQCVNDGDFSIRFLYTDGWTDHTTKTEILADGQIIIHEYSSHVEGEYFYYCVDKDIISDCVLDLLERDMLKILRYDDEIVNDGGYEEIVFTFGEDSIAYSGYSRYGKDEGFTMLIEGYSDIMNYIEYNSPY